MSFGPVSGDQVPPSVPISLNGKDILLQKRQNLATALLEAGVFEFNIRPDTQTARAPYCLMGSCFDCRLVVNGKRDTLACQTAVEPGIVVQTQKYDDANS